MSQENVEFAKRGIALWNRGDMDALRERYHPEAVMHHPPAWPEPGPSVGRDAIFNQFRRLREDAKTNQLEMTVLADPGDWIVWEYRWTAIGLESGLPMELVGAQATRYSAGQIVEVRFYADRAEALEAVGMRE
jgi:ketosteroid isomerase-like protein